MDKNTIIAAKTNDDSRKIVFALLDKIDFRNSAFCFFINYNNLNTILAKNI